MYRFYKVRFIDKNESVLETTLNRYYETGYLLDSISHTDRWTVLVFREDPKA